jgi:hypothetical protein
MDLLTRIYTYAKATHKFWWNSGAAAQCWTYKKIEERSNRGSLRECMKRLLGSQFYDNEVRVSVSPLSSTTTKVEEIS